MIIIITQKTGGFTWKLDIGCWILLEFGSANNTRRLEMKLNYYHYYYGFQFHVQSASQPVTNKITQHNQHQIINLELDKLILAVQKEGERERDTGRIVI